MGTATEDEAQRRPEHFPINAAGGGNGTAHSNTGGMRVEGQQRTHAELLSRCRHQTHSGPYRMQTAILAALRD